MHQKILNLPNIALFKTVIVRINIFYLGSESFACKFRSVRAYLQVYLTCEK